MLILLPVKRNVFVNIGELRMAVTFVLNRSNISRYVQTCQTLLRFFVLSFDDRTQAHKRSVCSEILLLLFIIINIIIIVIYYHQYYYYYYHYFEEYYYWLSWLKILADSLFLKTHKRFLRIIQNSPHQCCMPDASFICLQALCCTPLRSILESCAVCVSQEIALSLVETRSVLLSGT